MGKVDNESKINKWFYDGKLWNVGTDLFIRLLNNTLDYTLKENEILIDKLEEKEMSEKEIKELLQPNLDDFNKSQKELFDKGK